jgi:phosphoribosylamine---glycine ligase
MTLGRKLLVVGSGAREHALALRMLSSPSVREVIVCPGNAGTSQTPAAYPGKVLRSSALDPVDLAVSEQIDLVVVGPEVPLCEGLADRIRESGIPCFGPSKQAARLEGSKAFMKDFCKRHGISAAKDVVVTQLSELKAALAQFSTPPVVKADGLCAGKGVVVAESFEEAEQAVRVMLSGEAFGDAGTTVVLEERLLGSEASIHAICDGHRALLLPAAQDHKRIFDGDAGPNTGGMGTYAPAPVVTAEMLPLIQTEIMDRVVHGMASDGTPFVGALFAGLMISPEGEPKVLEFNVRFGDPETQVLTQVVDGDFFEALLQAAEGRLADDVLRASSRHALCVVMAAAGYPGNPQKGEAITGLAEVAGAENVVVFHAGTEEKLGKIVTAGGRVLGVTGTGASLGKARDATYAVVDKIFFAGAQFRRDIGHRAL